MKSHHHLGTICDSLHGVRSKVSFRQTQIIRNKMANGQAIVNEAIAKTVAEPTRVEIQAMAAATTERSQNTVGPKIGGPVMKQPTFN